MRLWVLRQMWPALRTLAHQDVVMLHLFEAESPEWRAATSRGARRSSAARTKRPSSILKLPGLPESEEQAALAPKLSTLARPLARVTHRRLHSIHAWARASSRTAAVPREQIFPIHVGLDLEMWTPAAPRAGRRTSDRACSSSARTSIGREEVCSFAYSSSTSPIRLSFTSSRRKPPQTFLAAFTSIGTCNPTMPASSLSTRVATCWCCPRTRIWCHGRCSRRWPCSCRW